MPFYATHVQKYFFGSYGIGN